MSKLQLPLTSLLKQPDIFMNCSDDEFKKCYLSGWNYSIRDCDHKRKTLLYKSLMTNSDFLKRKNAVLMRAKNKIKSPNKPILGLQKKTRRANRNNACASVVDDPLCTSDECAGLSMIHYQRHPELTSPTIEQVQPQSFLRVVLEFNNKTFESKIVETKIVFK